MPVSAAHRPELRPPARRWGEATAAALAPRVGPAAARAMAVYLDGVMFDALVRAEPAGRLAVAAALRAVAAVH